MEIKSYVNIEGNKIERLIPSNEAPEKFFGVAQAVNNGTPFEVRFPIEADDIDKAMESFDSSLGVFIKNVEAARAQNASNKNEGGENDNNGDNNGDNPKLVLNNG
jgi:hypothetical protein